MVAPPLIQLVGSGGDTSCHVLAPSVVFSVPRQPTFESIMYTTRCPHSRETGPPACGTTGTGWWVYWWIASETATAAAARTNISATPISLVLLGVRISMKPDRCRGAGRVAS